jgi:hypothetical protein
MKSFSTFLVSPKDGKSYDNEIVLGDGRSFVVSNSIENHEMTQRHAVVISVPHGDESGISSGDEVIVHHNVFRRFYDVKGREKTSSSHVIDNVYSVTPDRVYLFRKPGGEWMAPKPFMFVIPALNTDPFSKEYNQAFTGTVAYSCDPDINVGDEVGFEKWCEYKFKIDNQWMYRMFLKNIVWQKRRS